jgi:hypothetical protein
LGRRGGRRDGRGSEVFKARFNLLKVQLLIGFFLPPFFGGFFLPPNPIRRQKKSRAVKIYSHCPLLPKSREVGVMMKTRLLLTTHSA